MKSVALLLAVAGAAVLVSWLVFSGGAKHETALAPPLGVECVDLEARRRIEALEARVRELTARVEGIRDEAGFETPREPAIPSPPPETSFTVGDLGRDPHWYLDRYVASFDGGGAGSEHFRLAVDAYARDLLDSIVALVCEDARPLELRQGLIAMLGTPRFRGNWTAAGPLVARVKRESDAAVAAVRALLVIGDGECARSLESFACWIQSRELRRATFVAVVSLAADDADRAILRLLSCAPDVEEAAHLLRLARGRDPDAVLQLFEAASAMELPVRLAAAERIGEFRTDPIKDLTRAWRATEPDAEVRRRLEDSMAEQARKAPWVAEQAVGQPDANLAEDDPTSWASQAPDGGMEWIELDFPPLRASAVRVFEGLAGGAITEVQGLDASGEWIALWTGTQSDSTPGEYLFEFGLTRHPVSRIKIVLDTRRSASWNEIDAVELIGPDGSSWAIAASASSHFGQ